MRKNPLGKSDKQIYEIIVAAALDDASQYIDKEYVGDEPFVSVEETKEGLNVFDATDAPFEHEFTITKPSKMSLNWLKERIVVTPSAFEQGFDLDETVAWIHMNLPKFIYSSLDRLIFVGGMDDVAEEKDFDYLCNLDSEIANHLEEHDLPADDQLGINWFSANTCVVHIGHIINATKDMVDNGILYKWEEADCINHGVATSIIHELRHLAQSNIYIPIQIIQPKGKGLEEDAENYAWDFFEAHPVCLMKQENLRNKVNQEKKEKIGRNR